MKPEANQKLTLFNCLGLVLAVGVGFGLARFTTTGKGAAFGKDLRWKIAAGSWAVALPITWMLAATGLIGLGRSRDRPHCPPGVAACVAVAVASGCMLVFWSHNLVSNIPRIGWVSVRVWQATANRVLDPMPLAASVAATWTVLALDRRWRPETSWIDRAGRMVGTYWLAAGLAIPGLNIWVNWR